ncbi:MAG: lytic transglycosylase F [Candidatus Rokuibacteriota bacterium]|nr:MAG: lytic transglycosylase F [Candidatus Rokubacteria bacterium]
MVKRRLIRILVPYSKTYYFVDRAVQHGLTYEVGQLLERDLNKKLKTGNVRIHVVYVPTTRDKLIPALREGRGDIAMGALTITPERLKLVDFTDPTFGPVSEIVVTGPGAPSINTVDDLAGKEVYIRKSSSYYESVEKLNGELTERGKPEVKIQLAPETLEDEDILEMVNAGLVTATIVDDAVAGFWKQIFPQLTLHPAVAVRTGGEFAWVIRKDSPLLKAQLNAMLARYPEGSWQRSELLTKYFKNTKWAKAATSGEGRTRYDRTIALFQKYGDRYGIDYLLVMALGYQESELNQDARSKVGAVGVMQLMPATGKEMGVGDITQLDPNIHAGVKFLRALMNEHYANEPMDRLNKGLFTFAAYNTGPGHIRQLRKLAAQRRLNPNVWFDNVELIAAERIGRETGTYVSNIYKYYLAYQMLAAASEERERAKREAEAHE